MMSERKSYNVREAAMATGLSEKSIRRLIERGELPASKPLDRVLIPARALDELLERHLVLREGENERG
jgi:excisionase family DNA binding protein